MKLKIKKLLEVTMLEADHLIKMVSQIYRKTQMYLNERMKKIGLTSSQAPFIMITCENGKLSQAKFCELLDMDKSSVAKTLGKLEEIGYLQRKVNPDDSRSMDVYPTEKALGVFPDLRRFGNEWSVEITNGLTEIEKQIFYQILNRVSNNIGEYFKHQDS